MSLAQHLLDLHDQGASGWLQVTSRHGALGVVIHEGAPSASLRPGRAAESGSAARQALVEALTWVDAEVSFRVAATPPPIDRWSPHRLIIEATVRVFSEPELRAILDGVRHHRVVVAARSHGLVAEVTPPIAAAVARGMTVAELVEDVGRRVEGLAAIHGWVAMGILELLEPAPRTVVQQWRSSTTPPPRPVVIRRRQRPSPVPRVSTPPAVPRVSTPP
ncbi:MAG: DUF4388 domain-containing protein, partial [Myxococcales bacterium]|nr:DUF4388 domain-containing protein [Myxococcales bacterium]